MADFSDNDIVTVIRHCGHVFATDQLNIWFATHCTCPVCRFDIRSAAAATTAPTTASNPSPAPTTNPAAVTDPSGNNSRVANSTVPTIYDSILNSFQTVESVATLFTDPSGNYMYTDSDPLALFNLISRINDTYNRN